MKTSYLKKIVVTGLALAGLAIAPSSRAAVEVFIVGGSASSSVLFDRVTNILNSGTITVVGANNSSVRTFSGASTLPTLSGLGTITIDINLLGAVGGLQKLTAQQTTTNISGTLLIPTLVDSATSPEAVGIDSGLAHLTELPTYVVPLIYIKNTNSIDTAGITNLTQRQAWSLENSTLPATYFGGSSTNPVYFIGRNSQAAVRTEFDLNIYNTGTINSYGTNASGQPVLDTSADPGLEFGGAVANTVGVLTNSIGTVAVQNLTTKTVAIPYEGVPYSVSNVINGSYPLWGYEHYYYIASPYTGHPTTPQQAVIDAFYQGVTNTAFYVSSVFTNKFIPNNSLRVHRNFDGGQIYPNAGY